MNGHRLQRLADLERAVADAAICVVAAEKPVHLMSDAECVEEWRRLCRLPIPPPPEPDDDERDPDRRDVAGVEQAMTPAAIEKRLEAIEG